MKDWMRSKIHKPWKRATQPKALSGAAWLAQKERKEVRRKKRKDKKTRLREEMLSASERTTQYLATFWPKFNAVTNNADRLTLLKRAANPGWGRVTEELRRFLRASFGRKAYQMLVVPIEQCACCENRPQEKHHIVPLSYGGINEELNLIFICETCHNAIHPWMVSREPS